MFCEECGMQLPDTARFCARCGAPVVSDEGDVVTAPIVSAPVVQAAPFAAPSAPSASPAAAQAPALNDRSSHVASQFRYVTANSMTEAAEIAIKRAKEWTTWDDWKRPCFNDERWLRRRAARIDRKEYGTQMLWVISPDGAIGVLGEAEDVEVEYDIEWWMYTPAVHIHDLPRWRRDIGL